MACFAVGCSSTVPGSYVRSPEEENDTALASSGESQCVVPENVDGVVEYLADRIQAERDRAGLAPLLVNPTLNAVADEYACRMIDAGFFAHVDPATDASPGQRVLEAGYSFLTVGENLAAGQRTVDEVVQQWMDSEGHRENILGPNWRETGISVRLGGEYGVYWVQVFADPLKFGNTLPLPWAATAP
jgi:uncharacterized protein YkwD